MTNDSPDPILESPAHDAADERDQLGEGAAFPVVGVGASAGGLEAFTQLLKALPADTGMAFVLVQHLAPSHASALAEILSRATRMPVVEVTGEPTVEPNHVYVIPPDRSMIIVRGVLQLLPREGRGAHHPVDQFFRALAKESRHRAIGVVLSGTATDGTIGLEEIKAEGGITFAQDATAQHEGMPHSAIASGCVDFVLPPAEIAREIVRIGQHPYAVPEVAARDTDDKSDLVQVVGLLRQATGVDFTGYKFNTLYRRVTRRMVFQKLNGLADYVEFLRDTPAEIEALYQDILISVTSFFRDKESFEALKTTVFPRLLKDRSRHDPFRLWTLGCSTGQEAYSLAMAFTEAAEAAGSSVPIQLFASDLNAVGIEKARAGIYSKDIAQDVSPERLRRFFTEVDGQYRISKSIRDACIFSRHNVLADPPFSRIDLISCRNLLIYLEPVLQQKIMPTLHYALKPAGCLWLGGAETIGGYRNLFEAEDAKHKIYAKKLGSEQAHGQFPLQHTGAQRTPFVPITTRPSEGADLHREADRVLLTKFAPPGVLVNADLDILQYRGETGPFLAPAPGKASLNLLKMLREGLLVAVRAAVVRAGKEEAPVREEGLRVKSDGGYREVAIEVIPLKGAAKDGGFLVLFEANGGRQPPGAGPVVDSLPYQGADAPRSLTAPDPNNTRLEQELAATREYLQSVIEQQEAANEELQSANEEVQSANEELQSTNEELETSKEEIQSANEELATVNDELNERNAELHRANDDLVNLFGSIQMAVILLGPNLHVRRFTATAEELLHLIPTDVGRPISHIKLNFDMSELEDRLKDVIDTARSQEFEVQDKDGRWYLLRLRPYRTQDHQIDGAVMMVVDIDLLKRAHAYTESIVATVREPLLVLDVNLRVRTASASFYQTYLVKPEETINRPIYELGDGQWNIPELRRLLEEILPEAHQFDGFEVEHEFERVGTKIMRLNARRLVQLNGLDPLILLAIEDVTNDKRAEDQLRQNRDTFFNLIENAPFGLYILDAQFRLLQASAATKKVFRNVHPLIGRDFEEILRELWPEPFASEVLAHFRHTLKTGEPYSSPNTTEKRRDIDEVESYDWRIERVTLPDGQLGVVCYFYDITERKQVEAALQESEERFRDLADNIPQLAWIADAATDGQVRWFNRNWFEYTGTTLAEMTGQGWHSVHHPDHADRVIRKFAHHVREGLDWEDTFPIRSKNGQYGWFLSRMKVIRDESGKVVRIFGTNTDISEQLQMADALRQNAADMSEADRRKNEFLAMLAHELRNPLAPIRNALQILRLTASRGLESPENITVRSTSDMMERQVGQMVRLVDDLLDVSRVSRGKIELRKERIELGSVVQDAAEAARSLYQSLNHDLTVTAPPEPVYLNADPTRIAQVVGNLLNNACKFTDKGGHIELEVSVEKRGATSEREGLAQAATQRAPHPSRLATIRVRDNGVGIAADQLPRIFEMFMQIDTSLERSVSGLGIGLTLVKNLVEMHGGTVEVHSAGVGQGSEFVVRLPLASDKEGEGTGEEGDSAADFGPRVPPLAPPRRILVVDDNRDSATSLAMLLKLAGNETHTAYDGLEAVAAAESFRPDVVLLDIGLPKLNGYEACRKIRQLPGGRNILLIALTGWGQEDDRQRSSDAGFNAHMVKPIDLDALQQMLARPQVASA